MASEGKNETEDAHATTLFTGEKVSATQWATRGEDPFSLQLFVLQQSVPSQPQNRSPLRPSVSWHCPDTNNCRMQQTTLRNIDPSPSESHVTPLALLPAPAPATSWPPTSSIPPGTPFPAVPWPLCQHLFCTPEHGWGTAGSICRHSEALCPADFGAAQPCEGLTEVTPARVHRSRRFRAALVGTNSLQLWLRNWLWRKTALLCPLKSQPPS